MYSRGQDAETQFQAAQDALAQRAQAIQDSLDNNVQRQMFQQATARNLSNFRTQMYGHRNEQVIKWNAAESSARAERYVGEAVNEYRSRGDNAVDRSGNPTGKFAVNARNAMDEAVRSARLAGYPDDSEAMLGIKRKVMDDIAKGVAGRLMQDDDFSGGIRYLDSIREQMSPANYEQLRNTLVVNRERQMIPELGDSIRSGGGLSTVSGTAPFVNVVETPSRTVTVKEGMGDLEAQGRGGVMIEAQQGSKVVAPYDGVVAEVETKNGRTTVAIQLDNGDVAVISNLDPAGKDATSLYQNMIVGRGQTIGVMADEPIQYSLSRNGEPLPMDKVNSISADEVPRVPASEEEALAMANGIPDRETRDGVRTYLRSKYAEDAQREAQGYAARLEAANKYVARGQDIPPDIYAKLSAKDRASLMSPFAQVDDYAALETALRAPAIITHEWLSKNKGRFTQGTWNSLMGKADARVNALAKVSADEITSILVNNGFGAIAYPTTDADKIKGLMFRQYLDDRLTAARDVGTLTDDERRKIITGAVMNMATITTPGTLWGENEETMPISMMTQPQTRAVIERIQTKPVEAFGQTIWDPEKDFPALLVYLATQRDAALKAGNIGLAMTYDPTPENILYFYDEAVRDKTNQARTRATSNAGTALPLRPVPAMSELRASTQPPPQPPPPPMAGFTMPKKKNTKPPAAATGAGE
jgi:hypothetical protein